MNWVYKLSDIDKVAKQLLLHLSSKVLLLEGTMGMGKTTFVKAFVKALGINDVVGSPTFSLVNEYQGNNQRVYHFDFYRIEDESEAFDIGVEEYFYSKDWCLIEWSERIPSLIPENHQVIKFEWIDKQTRKLELLS